MRALIRVAFLAGVVAIACGREAQDRRPAWEGAGGGISLDGGGLDYPSCDCLPDCTTDGAAIEAQLCSSSTAGWGWLAVRTAYPGCTDVFYSSVTWDLSESFLLKDGLLAGCGASYTLTRDPIISWTGAPLDPACEAGSAEECSPCRDNADPSLRENAPPECE